MCNREHDYRGSIEMSNIVNKNLVSTAVVNNEKAFGEFTTMFRIPFVEGDVPMDFDKWKKVLGAWAEVCINALEARMDSCVNMLFRNRNNVIRHDNVQCVFRKSNGQIHSFNYPSFEAMNRALNFFRCRTSESIENDTLALDQLGKALYWVSEEDRQDHGGYGFGQLISVVHELLVMSNHRNY